MKAMAHGEFPRSSSYQNVLYLLVSIGLNKLDSIYAD